MGDRIVAVDSVPITAREGGRRLANLKAGRTVAIQVRRAGTVLEIVVVPTSGCNMPALTVRVP